MAATEQASEPQVNYIRILLRERDTDALTDNQRTWLESADFTTLSRAGASKVISALLALPVRAKRITPEAHAVPNGRYAIEHEGTLKFYKVNTPTEGRWAGRTFVEVQASDELYPVRDQATRQFILASIADDPQAAMLRYGQEIGSCGHCGRTLTNEESRQYGIGPICRGKMGW